MVTAPRGGLPTHTWLCAHGMPWDVPRAVMVWLPSPDARRAPHAPLPPLEPRPRSYTVQRRDHGEHTSGSPIVEEPRLANMSYNACKAAATPRKRDASSRLKKVDTERHSVSRPGSVTISFKNRCRLAVWHDRSFRSSHLSCGFESHRGHFLTLLQQSNSPPVEKNQLTKAE